MDTVNTAINPVPTCEGTATSTIINDYNSIIGFNGPNAYKICHLNGTFELLCPDLIPGGTPGAASIRLMNQVPQPAICSTVSINEIHNNTNHIFIQTAFPFVETTIFLNEQFESVHWSSATIQDK
ncbi:MAG: hypothetical protein IPO32_06200 [Crocinitomicaceae bacterium]|nr:hypothetical protein [Crocinitomicaceae bacterium]